MDPAFILSLQVAAAATAVALPPALGLAWHLARRAYRGRSAVALLPLLPLFLPPGVVGYTLARCPALRFTDSALIAAAALAGFPLLYWFARRALDAADPALESSAATLGASPRVSFLRVTLPQAWRGIAAGLVLCFVRAFAESGASAVVAFAAEGQRTLPLAFQQLARTPGVTGAELAPLAMTALGVAVLGLLAAGLLLRDRR